MITEIIVLICVIIGVVFNFLGVLGLLRFPDVYTRLHAATKCTTFGSIFLALGVAAYGFSNWYHGYAPLGNMGIHALFALLALLLTNPTGAHAIARAAHRSGVKPYGAEIDMIDVDKKAGKIKEAKAPEGGD